MLPQLHSSQTAQSSMAFHKSAIKIGVIVMYIFVMKVAKMPEMAANPKKC